MWWKSKNLQDRQKIPASIQISEFAWEGGRILPHNTDYSCGHQWFIEWKVNGVKPLRNWTPTCDIHEKTEINWPKNSGFQGL